MGKSYPFKIGTNWAIPQLQTIGRTAGFAPAICPGRRTGGLAECVKSVSARCIKLRTAKGKVASLFIQDAVAEFLPKEVPLDGAVTLYVLRVFHTPTHQACW
jgi:hypothetical protein